ncbi:MAG: beta-propeller domain-containing protein, partial [Verrucomicrobiota bacterium]
ETLVTAYSLARPTAVPAASVHRFEASPNAIMATDRFLFVATTGPSIPQPYPGGGFWYAEGPNTVAVIDISDPAGAIVPRGTFATRGRVQDKFKLHLHGEILTVVSHAGGTWVPADPARVNSPWTFRPSETWLETFRLAAPDRPARAGQLRIITNESLFATRFVGDRAYVVTFRQIDPLWIIDLSDPAAPAIRGELQIPGYSSYLQPLGTDRLIAMGVEQGNATVALFDVRDEARPVQLSKVFLGTGWSWSEANSDEKAFRVFPDRGLALVPWQGREGDQWVQAMQLIDVGESTLTKRGIIRHAAQARRATLLGDRLVSLSARELLTVDLADRDRPVITSDLELGFRVDRVLALGDRLVQYSASDFWNPSGAVPLLRLAAAAAPDRPVGVLALPRLSLVGWDLQGTTLQLVQHQPDTTAWETQGTNRVPVNVPGHLLASTVDCAGPAPVLRGSLRLPLPKAYGGASLAAFHPQPGITVWTEDSGDSFVPPWREYVALDGPGPVRAAPPRAARMGPAIIGDLARPGWGWWPWFWGTPARTLLALEDAAGAGPRLRSLVTQTLSGDSGSFGAAFEAGGRLHFSEQVAVREPLPAPTNSVPTRDPLLPVWQPEIWRTHHRLHVVDYADPGEPTVREPLTLPGALAGVALGGSLLVTRGDTRWDTNGATTTPLSALACDGLSASLVATLEEPGLRLHRVEPDGHLVATRPGPAGEPARLQLWALDPGAAWRRRADAPAPENVQEVRRFGSTLVTSGSSAIAFHAAPGGAALAAVGSTARPCSLWFDWGATDLAADGVLWVPRGEYGVTSLKPD